MSCFFVVYPYALYPFVLVIFNKLRAYLRKPLAPDLQIVCDTSFDQSVTVIIAAFNEEAIIAEKIENTLGLDYSSVLEVIVISDGSTDGTDKVVSSYCDTNENVRLLKMNQQSGKTAGLNMAVPLAHGDIVVFTDANAMFDKEALTRLVSPFNDPRVGYSVGSALYLEDDAEAVNDSEGLYWRYELFIKQQESDFYSVVGGDGAIYAIRRELYAPLESYDISDFVNPLQIVSKGYLGRFVRDARCYEHGTSAFLDEFRRKRRIVNRSWGAVRRNLKLFGLFRYNRFLFMLFSHKVIRWWCLPLVGAALLSGLLTFALSGEGLYFCLTTVIAATMVLGFWGWRLDNTHTKMSRGIYLFYFFYLIAIAGFLGIIDELKGTRQSIWQPSRK